MPENLKGIRTAATVGLTGGFRHGEISVDGQTVGRGPDGAGTASVELIPPTVDIEVRLLSGSPCTFKGSVEINKKKKEFDGLMKHSGRATFTFQWPFSDFGMDAGTGGLPA